MKRRGQVWIETVIYTLIAFVVIGAVLAFVKPKIEELQDKIIIDQTIEMIGEIDNSIVSIIQGGGGNKRLLTLKIKKGSLIIDGLNDKLVFEIESRYQYSEPGEDITEGDLTINTKEQGKYNLITLIRNYDENILFNEKDELKTISKSSTSYQLFITNKGEDEVGKIKIDFEIG